MNRFAGSDGRRYKMVTYKQFLKHEISDHQKVYIPVDGLPTNDDSFWVIIDGGRVWYSAYCIADIEFMGLELPEKVLVCDG